MHLAPIKRMAGLAALTAMALLLSACLLTPGKFTSSLDIRRSGDFAFTYRGEISLIGVAQLAHMGKTGDQHPTFSSSACHDSQSKERPCTPAELADQKQTWDRGRQEARQREQQETDRVKAMLGGLDPTDPRSLDEFAARLRRQAGWRAVAYKGDGLFDVDFATSGRLDHDFVFPVIERFPTTNTFVQLLRRNDGTVRIDAPGFAPSANGSMFSWMALGNFGSMGRDSSASMRLPDIDGTFTVTTDGQVLANNTDSGPKPAPSGQQLYWTVNVRSTAAPMALVRLDK
jgi:hypothetical protein